LIDLDSELAGIKGRWMTGLAGLDAAPALWKSLILNGNSGKSIDDNIDAVDDNNTDSTRNDISNTGASIDSTEAELRLLALVGQALQVAFAPEPSEPLQASRILPELALPSMPDEARGYFRRLILNYNQSAEFIAPGLELIEARGYSAHPFDWMPPATDQHVPALYAPWTDWLNNNAGNSNAEQLNEENWDDWLPAERRTAFSELRVNDPQAARTLLEVKTTEVAADERLRLVNLLTHKLSDADVPYLEGLATDRSSKVKVRASQLLARLGATSTDAELVTELADMLQLKRAKLLGGSKALSPKKLQNNAQKNRRLELFDLVPLHALANAFELTSQEAVETWKLTSDRTLNLSFATMVATTGDDSVQPVFASRILQSNGSVDPLYELLPRLSAADKKSLMHDALAIECGLFQLATELSRPLLGQLPLDKLSNTADYKWLTTAIAKSADGDDNRQSALAVSNCVNSMGLLLEKNSAEAAIRYLTDAGLLASDLQLDMLHLNAALTPRSVK